MINKNFEYYIGTTETAYLKEKIEEKALEEYKKEFGESKSARLEFFRFLYGNYPEVDNLYINWILNTIYNEIFANRACFTEEFCIIEIPPEIPENDALKLISIIRRAGIDYGLSIRRISSNSFASQWKKQYLTKTSIKLKDIQGADQYKWELKRELGKEILKNIRPKLSNYTRDVWEFYFKYGDTDLAGKYAPKLSDRFKKSEKEERELMFEEVENRQELAKMILNLIVTKHATIQQVQKMAEYYGVDLEKTMDSLEER